MDAAYDPTQWNEFAVMVGGATAAITGLLVVAMSINLGRIVEDRRLTGRAAGALITLVIPIVIAVAVLIPAQTATALGLELLAVGVFSAVCLPALNWPGDLGPHRTLRVWFLGSGFPMLLLVVPTVLAGIGVLTTSIGGLYWLPVAVVAAIAGGLLQAWVLLVEILR